MCEQFKKRFFFPLWTNNANNNFCVRRGINQFIQSVSPDLPQFALAENLALIFNPQIYFIIAVYVNMRSASASRPKWTPW